MNLQTFEFQFRIPSGNASVVIAPLLQAYSSWPPHLDEAADYRLRLQLIPHSLTAETWESAPGPRNRLRRRSSMKISVQLQYALRQWMQVIYMSQPELFDSWERQAGIIAYLSTRLYHPRLKDEYSYDLLMDEHIAMIMRSVRFQSEQKVELLRNSMHLLGKPFPEMRKSVPVALQILEHVEARPKFFFSLLRAESAVIAAWTRMQGRQARPPLLAKARQATRAALQSIPLRAADFGALAPMAEIEAMAALNLFQGRSAGRHLEVLAEQYHTPRMELRQTAWEPLLTPG
jgi:hypothetical protein